MSGTFEHIDVPPTLVSFAVSTARADRVLSAEFKCPFSRIYYIAPKYDENMLPDFEDVKRVFALVEKAVSDGKAISVWSLANGGLAEGIFKMSLGNRVGARLKALSDDRLFSLCYGAFIMEANGEIEGAEEIGETIDEYRIYCGDTALDLGALEKKWESVLEPIFKDSAKPLPPRKRSPLRGKRPFFVRLPIKRRSRVS